MTQPKASQSQQPEVGSHGKTIAIDPDLRVIHQPRSAKPVHPTITAEQISHLVDEFYTSIRRDQRLGPIFAEAVGDDWTHHLEKMKSFWRSVLLKTGEYHGRPVPVHNAIGGIKSEDFRIWLQLFRNQVSKSFHPEAADTVVNAAERIAQSLWLARFAEPSLSPPRWLKTSTSDNAEIQC